MVTWLKIFKPNVSTKKLSQMVLSQVTGNRATCHMAMPQCCYLAKGAKRPRHTTNTIKFHRIPFDSCNSIKRFDLCPFDQKNSTYLQPPAGDEMSLPHFGALLMKPAFACCTFDRTRARGKWSFRLMPFRLKSFRLTCLVTSPNFFRRNVFYFGHFA